MPVMPRKRCLGEGPSMAVSLALRRSEYVKVGFGDFRESSSEEVEQLGCFGSGDFMVS